MRGFAQLLSGFLLEYVPRRRSLSENTAKSYRDSFAILLRWLADGRGIAPDDVRIEDLSRENVESFCLWLSDVREMCIRDRSVTTTEVYAKASVEAKRKALEGLEQVVVGHSRYDNAERADILSWLRGLL